VFGETVVEEPTCPWNLVCDENGNCTENTVDPDESTLLNPCDVLGEDGACHGPLNQDDVCVNMDGQDSTCHGPLAEGQLRPEEQGFSSTQLGLYGAVGVATIAGLWYGVPWFYKKYIKKAEGEDDTDADDVSQPGNGGSNGQGNGQDGDNNSVNTDATGATGPSQPTTTTDGPIPGPTTGGGGNQVPPLMLQVGTYVLHHDTLYTVSNNANQLTLYNGAPDALNPLHFDVNGDDYLLTTFDYQGTTYTVTNVILVAQKASNGCGCGAKAGSKTVVCQEGQAGNLSGNDVTFDFGLVSTKAPTAGGL